MSHRRGRRHGRRRRPAAEPETWQQLESALDRLHAEHGFGVVSFSQRRASRQTSGVPDKLYLHEPLGLSFWFEAKFGTGELSEDQEDVIAALRACGHRVVVGGLAEARANLAELGVSAGGAMALCSHNAPAHEAAKQEHPLPSLRKAVEASGFTDLRKVAPGTVVAGPNGGWLKMGTDGVYRQVRRA